MSDLNKPRTDLPAICREIASRPAAILVLLLLIGAVTGVFSFQTTGLLTLAAAIILFLVWRSAGVIAREHGQAITRRDWDIVRNPRHVWLLAGIAGAVTIALYRTIDSLIGVMLFVTALHYLQRFAKAQPEES